MFTKAISPTAGNIHGTSHASQETQKITTTGNLTRHPKGNHLTHPRATCRGKRQRNPPQHHSDMHSAEYAPEQYSLPSEDME